MAVFDQALSSPVRELLQRAVEQGVFPGAVAGIARLTFGEEQEARVAVGELEPGGAKAVLDTPYDLASLTKPVVATLALRLCQAGKVDLHMPAAAWLPELEGTVGGESTLAALLSHRAGLSPWGGLYKELPDAPGSERARAFLLREAATRVGPTPIPTGSVYSDLGYLLLGEALSRAGGAPLDQLVQREVSAPLGCTNELYYAAGVQGVGGAVFRERVAPTELCSWRGRVIRGEVHDENCAAFGGVAGHAGLFGTARGVLRFGIAILRALEGRSRWIDQALLRWALRPLPGGGHVMGWDTKSEQGSSAGRLFSERSFGHLGFTGTSVWCDPVRSVCAVLLSNRVHPTRENIKIRELRPDFHDAVIESLEGEL